MAILITAGTDSVAYRLEQLLKPKVIVCFADYLPLPGYGTERRTFVQIPAGDSPTFAHSLLALCLDYDITEIYPLRKDELMPLAQSKQLFLEFGIEILVPAAPSLVALLSLAPIKLGELVVIKNGEIVVGNSKMPLGLQEGSGIFSFDNSTRSFSLLTVI